MYWSHKGPIFYRSWYDTLTFTEAGRRKSSLLRTPLQSGQCLWCPLCTAMIITQKLVLTNFDHLPSIGCTFDNLRTNKIKKKSMLE